MLTTLLISWFTEVNVNKLRPIIAGLKKSLGMSVVFQFCDRHGDNGRRHGWIISNVGMASVIQEKLRLDLIAAGIDNPDIEVFSFQQYPKIVLTLTFDQRQHLRTIKH